MELLWKESISIQYHDSSAFTGPAGIVPVKITRGARERPTRLERAMGCARVGTLTETSLQHILDAVRAASHKEHIVGCCPVCHEAVAAVPAFESLRSGSSGVAARPGRILTALHLVDEKHCWRIFHCKPRKPIWFALRTDSAGRLSVPQVLSWHLPLALPGNSALPRAKAAARVDLMLSRTVPCSFVAVPQPGTSAGFETSLPRLVRMVSQY